MIRELRFVNASKLKETSIMTINEAKEAMTGRYVELMDAIEGSTKMETFNGFIILLNDDEYYACLLMKVNSTTLTYIEAEASVINGTWLVKDWSSNENVYNMLLNIVMAQSTPSIGIRQPPTQEITEKYR